MPQQLTDRQSEIKELLDQGLGAREIAEKLEITRNAVYQQIQRLRKYGVLSADFTPTGLPAREIPYGPNVLRAVNGSDPGSSALVEELRRTRDELNAISARLTRIVGR